MLPRAACCFTRDSGSAGLFLDISSEALAANESDAVKDDRKVEGSGTEIKLQQRSIRYRVKVGIKPRALPRFNSSVCVVPHTAASPVHRYYFVHARRSASCLGALCD